MPKKQPPANPRPHPTGITLDTENPATEPSPDTSTLGSGVIEMPSSSEPLPDIEPELVNEPWQPPEEREYIDAEVVEEPAETFANVALSPASEDSIRTLLATQAFMLNRAIGRSENHWVYTDDELDLIAPGLARIARRNNLLKRATEASDAIGVAAGFGSYLFRNIMQAPPVQPIPIEVPREDRTDQEPRDEAGTQGAGPDGGAIPVGLPPR